MTGGLPAQRNHLDLGQCLQEVYLTDPSVLAGVVIGASAVELTGDGITSRVQSLSGNLIWTVLPKLDVGVELRLAERELESGADGKLETVSDLSPDTPTYSQVLLTRETAESPKQPGTIILRGRLVTATPVQGGGTATTTTPNTGGTAPTTTTP